MMSGMYAIDRRDPERDEGHAGGYGCCPRRHISDPNLGCQWIAADASSGLCLAIEFDVSLSSCLRGLKLTVHVLLHGAAENALTSRNLYVRRSKRSNPFPLSSCPRNLVFFCC
jgi:hypothetical protein